MWSFRVVAILIKLRVKGGDGGCSVSHVNTLTTSGLLAPFLDFLLHRFSGDGDELPVPSIGC